MKKDENKNCSEMDLFEQYLKNDFDDVMPFENYKNLILYGVSKVVEKENND